MTPWVRETLRWLLVIEIVMQPIVCVWLIVIALRIRRDQERFGRFIDVWAERLMTPTVVPDSTPKNKP